MVRRAIWTAAVTAIISKMSSTVMVNQPPGIEDPFSKIRYSCSSIQSVSSLVRESLG
ncbi:Uncharacterised protein [Mycobacterium tuberculosis]|uniref:Uncharacterized protein n=1 Tax=Mycobacterium tuberculosis TaxID=1773 RepID=A0A0U0QNC4_MYCTX|nr:Uncharacterised protein [Mycobacterium tuberculosis]CFR92956.1 Uncharacterised protein [Mycobacterium tuberculosis]CFS45131.1 Uncharacterised protein [Mycobacterium tuberculosis]CKP53219.1 Uncharacterised protein [Mycobacterium tuberculosis]CKT86973.1 Uncharacterised protein [Mycobacterium tuberculosis]